MKVLQKNKLGSLNLIFKQSLTKKNSRALIRAKYASLSSEKRTKDQKLFLKLEDELETVDEKTC